MPHTGYVSKLKINMSKRSIVGAVGSRGRQYLTKAWHICLLLLLLLLLLLQLHVHVHVTETLFRWIGVN